MQKIYRFILIAIAIGFVGCVQQSSNNDKCKDNDIERPIDQFVSNFLMDHHNYLNNDVTKEAGDKEFQRAFFDSAVNYLKNVPLRLYTTNKKGNKCYAKFEGWLKPQNNKPNSLIESINCDVITEVPDSMILNLKEGEYYCLEGKIIKRIDLNQLKSILGKRTRGITTIFGLRREHPDDGYEVNLGQLYFELDSLKEFSSNRISL